jgi:hypothetical protein
MTAERPTIVDGSLRLDRTIQILRAVRANQNLRAVRGQP